MAYANEPTLVLDPETGPAAGAMLLGRYRLETKIGSGGSADVWRARDVNRDRVVTIKMLRDRVDAETRRRFLDEGLWLETIEHKGIVRAIGRHDVLGQTLIVFEYVEGETLAELLERGPVAPRQAAAMTRDIASAIDALHGRGVLHLDLKPANILVGKDGRPRLIDLGIADLVGNMRTQALGTPRYAAPEVKDGLPPTKASDLYGLALVTKEMLGAVAADPKIAAVLRIGLRSDPKGRPVSAGRFATVFTGVVLLRELGIWWRATSAVVLARIAPLRTRIAARLGTRTLPKIPAVTGDLRKYGRWASFAGVALVLLLVVLALPRLASGPDVGARAAVRPYALPPLGEYAAAFEWQAPYPTAVSETEVEWVLALRNTGAVGWFADRDGARATLALTDGRIIATQSERYVGPGDVAIFHVRFLAPAQPGVHRMPVWLVIDGTGTTPDLGIYADVTVTARRSVIGGRH